MASVGVNHRTNGIGHYLSPGGGGGGGGGGDGRVGGFWLCLNRICLTFP